MVSTRASMYAMLDKEKVCVLCARACVFMLYFIFKSLRPHGLECALNLGVRSLMPLCRHGSTCFGESSNRPTVTDVDSIRAQGVAKCGRVAT